MSSSSTSTTSSSASSRLPAVIAYLIPVIGWVYVIAFQRHNRLAVFHVKQAIGLFLFLLVVLVGWAVIAWVLAWIPLLSVLSVGLFTLVMAVFFYGVIAWIFGMINALNDRYAILPGLGQWANNRLPIE